MTTALGEWRNRGDRWAGPILLAGILLGVGYNVAKWPRDRDRALALRRALCGGLDAVSNPPRVSILVAAWNERDLIERHLESVRQLRYPNIEHIVCAGGDDGTYELAQRQQLPGLILLRQQPGEGQQQAVARCLDEASGAVTVLTDADCILDDASFERLLAPILHEREVVTTGPFKPLLEQMHSKFVVNRWAATTYRYLRAGRYVEGLTGANSAVSTDALRASHAFMEPTWIGMDVHLATRLRKLGHQTRFVHSSEVAMHFEENFATYARQRSRWLGGILMHALAERNWYQIVVVAVFYAVGQAFVWLPLSAALLRRAVLAVWVSGVVCAILNRLRYLAFTSLRTGVPLGSSTYLAALFLVPRDLLALAYAPVDMLMRLRTKRW